MSRNNNLKGNKNSKYSINPGSFQLINALFAISQFIQRKIKDYPIRIMTINKNII